MNLIKSFNFKYLKENIKKSKGLIILLLIVVPLLTTLYTILFINGKNKINIASASNISWINFIGMFVIPMGLSFALFGYIYKKSSVDLINSMPLNKQTIFITNTIGGIILLTLMQVITMVLLILCSVFCTNMIMFVNMIFDIFIMMLVGYIFMFIATNVAMTLSGTFMTQLVLTALILFLIPFIRIDLTKDIIATDYKINSSNFEEMNRPTPHAYIEKNYIVPINLTLSLFDNGQIFSMQSLGITILLGIIYIALGTILFKRRKMEDTEESFKDKRVHLLVKALTIFPMVAFLYTVNPSDISKIFLIAIISIYYFAYDFIVKNKVKILVSLISLVVTIGVSYGISAGMDLFSKKVLEPSRVLNIDDIEEVAIGFGPNATYETYNYFIKDEEVVNIIKNSLKEIDKVDLYFKYLNVSYKTKSGKVFTDGNAFLNSEEDYDKLIELLSKDENFVKMVKKELMSSGKFGLSGIFFTEEQQEAINLEFNKAIDKMSLKEIYEKFYVDDGKYYSDFRKVSYKNHKYRDSYVPITTSPNIEKIIMNYQNSVVVEGLNKSNYRIFRLVGNVYNDELNNYTYSYNKEYYYDPYEFSYTKDEIINFIKNNKDEVPDPTKPFYQIQCYTPEYSRNEIFYTNKIDEINEIVKKEYNHNIQVYENTNEQFDEQPDAEILQ